MKQENTPKPDKNSRPVLEARLRNARGTVLAILLMTVLNLLFLFLDYGRYFLFSASVPYYGVAIAKSFELDVGPFAALAVVILAAYLVCWILGKKKPGAITAALVLFGLDTLALLGVIFGLMENPLAGLMDLLFHALVLVELAVGVSAGAKLKKLPPEPKTEVPPVDGVQCL